MAPKLFNYAFLGLAVVDQEQDSLSNPFPPPHTTSSYQLLYTNLLEGFK